MPREQISVTKFKPTLPILSSNLSPKFNVRNEMKFILKRDGTKQEYLPYKIQDAIKKAFESESKEYDDNVFLDVMGHVFDSEVLSVEDVQDYIEKLSLDHKSRRQHREV